MIFDSECLYCVCTRQLCLSNTNIAEFFQYNTIAACSVYNIQYKNIFVFGNPTKKEGGLLKTGKGIEAFKYLWNMLNTLCPFKIL